MATQKIILAFTIFFTAFAIFGMALALEPAIGVVPTKVSIFIVGDIMLDRTVRKKIDTFGARYPFENIKDIFSGTNIVIGNLEGGFTDNPSVSIHDNTILHFTFDPALAPKLKELGFTAVSLANNHAADFGMEGYASTLKYLKLAGIVSFGSPSNDIQITTIEKAQGKKIALIGYHEFYAPSLKPIINEINSLRNTVDFIIVYPHWGVEYERGHTNGQQAIAHAFIDAGADAVIGSHPHVIEPIEIYKGKAIFYSLGNFVFDQDFSLATRQGLAVKMMLQDKDISYELVPITMKYSKTSIPTLEERMSILNTLAQKSDVTQSMKHDIRNGFFKLPVTQNP